MTREEVNAIVNLADVNADGKFDYIKVYKLILMSICLLCTRSSFKGAHLFNVDNDMLIYCVLIVLKLKLSSPTIVI